MSAPTTSRQACPDTGGQNGGLGFSFEKQSFIDFRTRADTPGQMAIVRLSGHCGQRRTSMKCPVGHRSTSQTRLSLTSTRCLSVRLLLAHLKAFSRVSFSLLCDSALGAIHTSRQVSKSMQGEPGYWAFLTILPPSSISPLRSTSAPSAEPVTPTRSASEASDGSTRHVVTISPSWSSPSSTCRRL